MPDQFVHDAHAIWFKDVFMVVCTKVLSDHPGMLKLTIIFIRESNRKSLDWPRRQFRHESEHCAGINPATQETAKRYITDHSQSRGSPKPAHELLLRLFPDTMLSALHDALEFPIARH